MAWRDNSKSYLDGNGYNEKPRKPANEKMLELITMQIEHYLASCQEIDLQAIENTMAIYLSGSHSPAAINCFEFVAEHMNDFPVIEA